MNPKLLFGLNIIALVINGVSCTYQPWEQVKEWYVNEEYDREGADVRHSVMEKNCTEVVGENEGLCFDECMFRNEYQMLQLDLKFELAQDSLPYTYSLNQDRGYQIIAGDVLQLKGAKSIYVDEPKRERFWQRFSPCEESFEVEPETDEKLKRYHWEATKNLCTLTFNLKEKETMTRMVNCVKEKFTSPL